MDEEEIADRITKIRKQKGWSQADLAKMSNITEGAISLYEGRKRIPSAFQLINLAKTLGVTSDYLLGIDIDLNNAQNQGIIRNFILLKQHQQELVLEIIRFMGEQNNG